MIVLCSSSRRRKRGEKKKQEEEERRRSKKTTKKKNEGLDITRDERRWGAWAPENNAVAKAEQAGQIISRRALTTDGAASGR